VFERTWLLGYLLTIHNEQIRRGSYNNSALTFVCPFFFAAPTIVQGSCDCGNIYICLGQASLILQQCKAPLVEQVSESSLIDGFLIVELSIRPDRATVRRGTGQHARRVDVACH
jgi:hypothetical protein